MQVSIPDVQSTAAEGIDAAVPVQAPVRPRECRAFARPGKIHRRPGHGRRPGAWCGAVPVADRTSQQLRRTLAGLQPVEHELPP